MSTRLAGWMLVAAALTLAGCGVETHSADGAGSGAGGAPATSVPTEEPAVGCGDVNTLGPRTIAGPGGAAATSCFLAAFTSCHPATLTITQGSIDTVTVHRLSIDLTCHVTDQATFGMVGAHFSPRPGQLITCSGVHGDGAGGIVITGCGSQGDITVAVPSSIP